MLLRLKWSLFKDFGSCFKIGADEADAGCASISCINVRSIMATKVVCGSADEVDVSMADVIRNRNRQWHMLIAAELCRSSLKPLEHQQKSLAVC